MTTTRGLIRIIEPFRPRQSVLRGWVFDDEAVGLSREAFVSGADELIDRMADEVGADLRVRLHFSDQPFPGYNYSFTRLNEEFGGNWYQSDQHPEDRGWLCPALYLYYEEAPEAIFVRAEAVEGDESEA